MTESLKSMMAQQAASIAFKPPDLDAIARDNNRRIRRRRVTTVLAGAVAVAVVAGTAAVLSNLERRPEVVADPIPTGTVSWAAASTIHNGTDTVILAHKIRAYVRTPVGFVTVDRTGNVYSITSRGHTRIGQLASAGSGNDHVRLVADPGGTLVGWVGGDQSGLTMQIYDQATGQTSSFPTAGAKPPGGAVFFAIDGRTAYWRIATRNAILAVDLDTGAERQLASGDRFPNLEIWGAQNGVFAFTTDRQPGGNVTSIRVGRSVEESQEFTFKENAESGPLIQLSPTGAWLAYLLVEFDGPPIQDKVLAFTGQVRDARTGDLITLDLPGVGFISPAVWLDDTTLQILGIGEGPGLSQRANMFACRIPEGTCTAGPEIPATDIDGNALVTPNGVWVNE
ncbi:MAG TPA: hypothetical protein VF062_12950 [Candidatus Limnocylindrales bacterium]